MTFHCTKIGKWFSDLVSLNEIIIGDEVASIERDAFAGTAWYNNQPDGLVYAGKCAYQYKGSMPQGTEIVIQDGTTIICDYAFYNCKELASVKIPSSITSVGSSSFKNNNRISKFLVNSKEPPYTKSEAFVDSDVFTYAKLYVPVGCKSEYESAYGWRKFINIIEDASLDGGSSISNIFVDSSTDNDFYINLSGQIEQVPQKGKIYIHNGKKVVYK